MNSYYFWLWKTTGFKIHKLLKSRRGFFRTGSKNVYRKCLKLGGFFMSYLHLYTVTFVLYNITEIYQIMINQSKAAYHRNKERKHMYYTGRDSHQKSLKAKDNHLLNFGSFGMSIQKACYCRVWSDRVIVTRVIIGCKLTELYSVSSSHRQNDQ